jgi:glycerol-3-phosphate dehydrogenase (NAD(P)+)
MTKVSIIGSGAWGSALACVSARAGHETIIWGRSEDAVFEINTSHTNRKYLDDLVLENSILATVDIREAVECSDMVLLSIPTQMLSSRLDEISKHVGEAILVTCCKGIDRQTGKLPAELVSETFPSNSIGALSGPSFATDVVAGLPTAVTVASEREGVSDILAGQLSTDTFRCYSTTDVNGVELGGALKNVLALAVGAARGMGLGASAEAALMARGFSELRRLATGLGAKTETLSGLSGFGDLVLTCSSPQSRNFSYGMAMGRGESLEGLKLAEGAHTASVALKIADEKNIDVPIIGAIVNVLEKKATAKEAVHSLLSRPLKRES